jgi:pyruvate/2-oxoglutarate/acetoin dehydrogenase E1 component
VLDAGARTHRAILVDEGWKTCGLAAELSATIAEEALYELDAPVARVCTAEVPIPYAQHLEAAALPSVDRITAAVRDVVQGKDVVATATRGE